MTHLTKVGATYYYRRVVPHELRPYFLTAAGKPRTEFMVSLRTKERPLAIERNNLEAVKHDRLIREARGKLERGVRPEPAPAGTTAGTSPRNAPFDPFPTREAQEYQEDKDALDAQEEWGLENDPIRQRIQSAVQDALIRRDRDAREATAYWEAEGAAKPKIAPKGTRLAILVDQYAAERKPNAKRIDAMVAVASWFEAHVGRIAVEAITPENVLAFKDKLLAITTEANAQTKLRNINTLLLYAKNQRRIIRDNPAAGITITVKARLGERRREMDQAALAALFGTPVYTDGERPDAGAGEAAYWLPLLGLYTGARLNELGQLRPTDVFEERVTYKALLSGTSHLP